MKGYHFFGTPLPLTDSEAYRLEKHLKKGRKAGRIVSWERFEFDLPALLTPVALDCGNCHLAHLESCCEGGFPFPPALDLLPVLDEHLPRLAARHLTEPIQAHIRAHRLYERHLETAGHRTIGTLAGGNCLFCTVEADGPACMAHRYALEEGMRPEQLKPLSCLLYPLDLIEDEAGRVLVTALTEETARFSRWGEEYRRDFVCANLELRDQAAAGEDVPANIRRTLPEHAFARERYQSACAEGRDLLVSLFGEEMWHALQGQIRDLQEKEADSR